MESPITKMLYDMSNLFRATGTSEEKITQKWRCPVTDVEYHESAGSEYTKSLTRGTTGSVVIESSTYPRLGSTSGGESAALQYQLTEYRFTSHHRLYTVLCMVLL